MEFAIPNKNRCPGTKYKEPETRNAQRGTRNAEHGTFQTFQTFQTSNFKQTNQLFPIKLCHGEFQSG